MLGINIGSVTSGHMDPVVPSVRNHPLNKCNPEGSVDGLTCVYPHVFNDLLQRAYPHTTVNVTNLAIPGCFTQSLLNSRLREMLRLQQEQHIDVVTVFMNQNDGGEWWAAGPFEVLIRFLLNLHSKIAVIMLHMHLPRAASWSGHDHLQISPPHLLVARHYQLPIIAVDQYAETSMAPYLNGSPPWDVELLGDHWWPLWMTTLKHPPWLYQRALAQFLYSVWVAHSERAAATAHAKLDPAPLPPPLVNSTHFINHICYETKEDLRPETWSGRYSENGGWVNGEDVRGKPGLWVDNINGATLKFRMLVRLTVPLIGLSYLQSYEKVGIAEIFIEDEEQRRVIVNPRDCNKQISMTVYKALCVKMPPAAAYTFPSCEFNKRIEYRDMDARLFSMQTLVIRLTPATNHSAVHNKFKVLQVTSC